MHGGSVFFIGRKEEMANIIIKDHHTGVKQQKQIINYVNEHQDRHGSDNRMRQAMQDYGEVSKKIGFNTKTVLNRSDRRR